ncbi:MAG: hypothetical protein ACJ75R_04115 [Solirubrobacterales bacterium]
MSDRVERAVEGLAGRASRRGFLARVGAGLTALTAGGLIARAIKPGEAEAHHFCGHTFTTGSCIHPLRPPLGPDLPRIDRRGYPLRPSDGVPIDNLGRPVNDRGEPVGPDGQVLHDPDGRPLPPAPRTRICERTAEQYGFKYHLDGSWYRCCDGHVRRLLDCCGYVHDRINGDAALTGYCYSGRKVFCVQYYDTKVPC